MIAPHQIACIAAATAFALAGLYLVAHAPRCTGSMPADLCPLAGGHNTNAHDKN